MDTSKVFAEKPVTSDATDANTQAEFDFTSVFFCLLTLDLRLRTVIIWKVAEKPVTSDATDASVTYITASCNNAFERRDSMRDLWCTLGYLKQYWLVRLTHSQHSSTMPLA